MTNLDVAPDEAPAPATTGGRVRAALWPGEWREAVARWFIVALGLALLVTALWQHPGLWWALAAAVAVVLVVQARRYRAAQAAVDDEPDEEDVADEADAAPAEDAAPEPDPAVPDMHPSDVADLCREVMRGARGAHLTALADQLATETGEAWDTARVRALLAAAGIPHRHSVRAGGQVAVGVHADDLPSPTPSEGAGSGVAEQVSGATATATRVEYFAEGAWVEQPDEHRQTVAPRKEGRP